MIERHLFLRCRDGRENLLAPAFDGLSPEELVTASEAAVLHAHGYRLTAQDVFIALGEPWGTVRRLVTRLETRRLPGAKDLPPARADRLKVDVFHARMTLTPPDGVPVTWVAFQVGAARRSRRRAGRRCAVAWPVRDWAKTTMSGLVKVPGPRGDTARRLAGLIRLS
ncbi:hypothetical protein [Nocardioides ferulae]|uniref:hypothetical protein n=1 Tax=Nocardioides ferulae TaxID=2340821 RepID=UPI000EABB88B|nr:hypothetical protein [Nocardioides ferulae]